jgi:hypothetical protein
MITTRQIKIILNDRKLTAAFFMIIVGFLFLGWYFLKDKVKSKSDIVEIRGSLRDYSFAENEGLRNHTFSYFLYFNNYNNRFQISADIIDYFNKKYFEKTIKRGDTLKVCISQKDFKKLNKQGKLNLFGIYDNQTTYLDCNNVIYLYNSTLTLYSGLIFILVGLVLYYVNKEKLIDKK